MWGEVVRPSPGRGAWVAAGSWGSEWGRVNLAQGACGGRKVAQGGAGLRAVFAGSRQTRAERRAVGRAGAPKSEGKECS